MTRLLFMVHGMGHQPDGWHGGAVDVLRGAAQSFGLRDDFDRLVAVHAIGYDAVFRGRLERWDRSVGGLRTLLAEQNLSGSELVDWLDGASETEANFFWSHVVDVLLYRFFPQIATEVRARWLHRLVSAVNAAMEDGATPPVHLLAHSLGTAVSHDALAYLATNPIDGSDAFTAEHWRLASVFMVANVGRVLERTPPVYASPVRPVDAPGPGRPCTTTYYNFRHTLDPVPAVRPFAPNGWGRRYRPVETLDHILDFNVHGLAHYLRHPDVHVPILNRLLDDSIDRRAHDEALARFTEERPPDCADVLNRLRGRLREACEPVTAAADPVQLLKVAARVYALAREARDEC